jgi:hypothetical protein
MPLVPDRSTVAPMTTAALTSSLRRAAARITSSPIPAAVRTATTGPSSAGIPTVRTVRWA